MRTAAGRGQILNVMRDCLDKDHYRSFLGERQEFSETERDLYGTIIPFLMALDLGIKKKFALVVMDSTCFEVIRNNALQTVFFHYILKPSVGDVVIMDHADDPEKTVFEIEQCRSC